MPRSRAAEISSFTIIKGSLIEETYAAFRHWDLEATDAENFGRFRVENPIGAGSLNWLRDVSKVLHRRFDPLGHDLALVLLAKAGTSLNLWKPMLLWHMTRDEFLVRDFVTRWLATEYETGRYAVRTEDILRYFSELEGEPAAQVVRWGDATRRRVAAGLARMAADFGLLQGAAVKHFAQFHLPDESFLYILHAIAEAEPNARRVVDSPEWRLFLMGPSDVEESLFRLHQFRLVHYQVAGSLAQLELPCGSSFDYARRLCA